MITRAGRRVIVVARIRPVGWCVGEDGHSAPTVVRGMTHGRAYALKLLTLRTKRRPILIQDGRARASYVPTVTDPALFLRPPIYCSTGPGPQPVDHGPRRKNERQAVFRRHGSRSRWRCLQQRSVAGFHRSGSARKRRAQPGGKAAKDFDTAARQLLQSTTVVRSYKRLLSARREGDEDDRLRCPGSR